MSGCDCQSGAQDLTARRVLITLLAINAVMFVIEGIAGWLSESAALLADALDMLADAAVYGIALYVVGKVSSAKAYAAMSAGIVEFVLAFSVVTEVVRRILVGSEPEPLYMLGVGMLALAANVSCLVLLKQHRNGEVHMRASWIFSKNDVIANVGVILAGGLVYTFGTPWPDYIIGIAIGAVVLLGALTILRESRAALKEAV